MILLCRPHPVRRGGLRAHRRIVVARTAKPTFHLMAETTTGATKISPMSRTLRNFQNTKRSRKSKSRLTTGALQKGSGEWGVSKWVPQFLTTGAQLSIVVTPPIPETTSPSCVVAQLAQHHSTGNQRHRLGAQTVLQYRSACRSGRNVLRMPAADDEATTAAAGGEGSMTAVQVVGK